MAEKEKDYSYFHKGIQHLTTPSSVLISSSKYLNSPELRDWIATHFMRRNGADFRFRPTRPMGSSRRWRSCATWMQSRS
jgi:hypothetical protein